MTVGLIAYYVTAVIKKDNLVQSRKNFIPCCVYPTGRGDVIRCFLFSVSMSSQLHSRTIQRTGNR